MRHEHLPLLRAFGTLHLFVGVSPSDTWGINMANVTLGMGEFARFYEATRVAQVRIVREYRSRYTDPKGYRGRDYYRELRNVLLTSHWRRGDLRTLPTALEELVDRQTDSSKAENLREISASYIEGWHSRNNAELFMPPYGMYEIANVAIRITPEVGMKFNGDEYALKLWFNRPVPKRQYRQAIQYLMDEGRPDSWSPWWHTAMWDVRRDRILEPLALPRDFEFTIRTAAVSFLDLWTQLGGPVSAEEEATE